MGLSHRICLVVMIASALSYKYYIAPAAANEGASQARPDLARYVPVLLEDFSKGLSLYDGTTGIWSTDLRRDVLVTNSAQSVFLDGAEVTASGEAIGLDPFRVADGVLRIGSGVIPEEKSAAVGDLLDRVGQGKYKDSVRYYTGRITTGRTWAQTYGYFEIVAKVPAGQGHWSAFWLSAAGIGWPPEIDVFEAYGKGLKAATPRDDVFNVAVFFDEIDARGARTQSVDIVNPYAPDAEGRPSRPEVKNRGRQHVFNHKTDAKARFGADIYESFWTYAVEWTPDEIIFYFGKSRDSLVEIYRAPTPDDLRSPMAVIANDQIGTLTGWWDPVPGQDDLTFAPGNDLEIASISVYALLPSEIAAGDGVGATIIDTGGATRILGTPGDDVIVPGTGLDVIELGGGRDTVFVDRGVDGKIISGFGADDRLVLEGFRFDGAEDALARLTQVGADVWLSSDVDPADPQTIVFRDVLVRDFAKDQFIVRWPVTPDLWSSALRDGSRRGEADAAGVVRGAADGSKLTDAKATVRPATLAGSQAPDLYYVTRSDTVIREPAGGGVDTVRARVSYSLPDHVENLISEARRDGLVLEGNAGDNRITGGPMAETLIGGGGDDLIDLTEGGADRVVYAAGDGHDTIIGFGADDTLVLKGILFPSWEALRARLSERGGDMVLDLGAGQSVTFRATPAEILAPERFLFETGPAQPAGGTGDPWHRPRGRARGRRLVEPGAGSSRRRLRRPRGSSPGPCHGGWRCPGTA